MKQSFRAVSSINVPPRLYKYQQKGTVFTIVLRWYNRYDNRNPLGINVTYKVKINQIGRFFKLIEDRKIPYSDLSKVGVNQMIAALGALTDPHESPRHKVLILDSFGLDVIKFNTENSKKG